MAYISAGKNYAPNPSFETTTLGWATAPAGGTEGDVTAIARSNVWAWAGDWAGYVKLVANPSTGLSDRTYMYFYTSTTHTSATSIQIPAEVSQVSVSFRIRAIIAGGGAGNVRMTLVWRNELSANVGSNASPLVPFTGEVDALITFENLTKPAGATFFYLVVYVYGSPAGTGILPIGSEAWIDALQVNGGPTVERYIDGDQGARYSWDGTPHQSSSTRAALTYSDQAHPTRGKTHISAELWRHSLTNEPVEDITPLALSGKVTYNSNAELKGALSLAISDMGKLRAFEDLVAPFITLTNAAGESQRHQLGLFALPPSSKESYTPTSSRGQLEGRDVLWYMANNAPTTVVNYAGSTNVVSTVIGIVQAHGLAVAIPASSKTFGSARSYHPDKSWLEIANDMLNGIGYYTLWPARTGVVKSRPYFELASAQPTLELYSGEGSMVIGSIDRETLGDTLANRVVVYKANPQGAPIIASRVNDDPLSPISTVNLGRTITRRIPESTLVDQAAADAMAQRILEESASNTRKLAITTLPLPDRDLHEVYDLAIYDNDDTARAFGKWWCDMWEMSVGFRPVQATMVHHIKRLEPYGGSLG